MARGLVTAAVVVWVLSGSLAEAQPSAGGSVRGSVRDIQGAALPGVSIVMTSPDAPIVYETITDQHGTYRLHDLPPGTYTLRASLSGFSQLQQQAVIRAGLNVTLDLTMPVAGVTETVQVRHEPPLLESTTATSSVNISGTLQRQLPLHEGHSWASALHALPGVTTRLGFNSIDYSVSHHGSDSASHAVQLDGVNLTWAVAAGPTNTHFNADLIQDIQVKTAAADASAPLGLGAVISVVTRSGTNQLKGTLLYAKQAEAWNSQNGSGSSASVAQDNLDILGGGPVALNHAWWFAALRRQRLSNGLSRTAEQVQTLEALVPGFAPFDLTTAIDSYFFKPSLQLQQGHFLEAHLMWDRRRGDSAQPYTQFPSSWVTQGPAASLRLSSTWGSATTSRVVFAWNAKRAGFAAPSQSQQPSTFVYATSFLSGTTRSGADILGRLGAPNTSWNDDDNAVISVAADVSHHLAGLLGTHDVQLGLAWQPLVRQTEINIFANGGFARQDLVLSQADDLSSPLIPFHEQHYERARDTAAFTESHVISAYIQDAWRPTERLVLTGGVRMDLIRRRDRLCQEAGYSEPDCITQDSAEIGPRFGINYLLTQDGRTRLYASAGRIHEALAQAAASATLRFPGLVDTYDLDLDGTLETTYQTPARTALDPTRLIDVDHWHQPYVTEYNIGLARQFPGSITATISGVHRDYRDRATLLEVNGLYEGSVFRGYRDERFNEIHQVTNNRWNWPVYDSLEVSLSRQTSDLQLLASYTRQWRHLAGTWQPHDPAAFVQPNAFANNRGIGATQGLTHLPVSSFDTARSRVEGWQWRDHAARATMSWTAPGDFIIGWTYIFQSGTWSGPIFDRVESSDPAFGPASLVLSNGRTVPNPLSTTIRFAYPTRGDNQLRSPNQHTLNVRIGRSFRLKRATLDVFADVFNVFNGGADTAFASGANQLYSQRFGATHIRQLPRSAQLGLRLSL